MIATKGRDRRLLGLLDAVRGRKSSLIQVHNNPDPDALASAMGMREIYQRYLNVKSRIVFGGILGRAENRTMLRTLEVEIVPVELNAAVFVHAPDTAGRSMGELLNFIDGLF